MYDVQADGDHRGGDRPRPDCATSTSRSATGRTDGAWAVRTYLKPFANWIWLGALVMAAGGVVSLTDRRYRVGAPARRAPAAVAAE